MKVMIKREQSSARSDNEEGERLLMKSRKIVVTLLLMCLSINAVYAQKITHSFNGVSMSKALEAISSMSRDYTITFIYNELEDFTVTTRVVKQSVTDAIRQIIGFYPMKMTIDGKDIFVECVQKEKRKLIGKIVETNGDGIPYANIALLSIPDSAWLNSGVSNEAGDFAIPCSHDEVLMRVSYVGYNTLYRKVKVGDIGNIVIRPGKNTLSGLTVKGERPLITHVENRTIFHVDAIANKESLNASDLLNYVPRVTSTPDGDVKLDNRDVVIYLNNRKLHQDEYRSVLAGISATDIERIETQSLHGSEESAETQGGVVYIFTKEKLGFSCYTSAYGSLFAHHNFQYYPYLNLYFGTERWNIYGNYYFLRAKNQQYSETNNNFLYLHNRHLQTTDYKYRQSEHNYRVGGMYYIDADKHHNIGVEVNGNIKKSKHEAPGNTVFTDTLGTDYAGKTELVGSENPKYVDVAASYKWTIDEKNSFLNFIANYNHQTIDREDESVADYELLKSRNVDETHTSNALFNNLTTDMDFRKNFNHGWSIKAGGEFQITGRKSLTINSSRINADADNRQNWRYRENIGAGYLGLSKNITDNIFAMASIRFEQTNEKGYDIDTDKRLLTKDYSDWIPYLYFSHKVNDKFSYEAAYTTSVYRPAFSNLVNYTNRMSDALYDKGNPELQREVDKQLYVSASLGKHSLTLSYSGASNTMAEDFQAINGITYHTMKNIGKRNYVYLQYSYAGKLWSWWQLNLSAATGNTHCSPSYNKINHWGYSINVNSDLIVHSVGTFNVMYHKDSGDIFMNLYQKGSWYVNASFRRNFFDNKLSLRCGINDIFNSNKQRSTFKNPLLTYTFYAHSDTRNVFVSIAYNFSTKSKVRGDQMENENSVKNRM
jgi:hypothetical protein